MNLARFRELYSPPNSDSEPIVPYVKEIVELFHIALTHFKAVNNFFFCLKIY